MEHSIEERVAMGAVVLDECERGWYRRIDIKALWITSTESCILGQVFGGFVRGTQELGIEGDRFEEERLGFELTASEYTSDFHGAICEQYEDAWRAEIRKRLA